jgi:3-oxoacyl-[acyl-carrier protein] reductase
MAKRVLVTGSSRGIGKAIALVLAKSGFEVVVHCRENKAAAEKTLQAIKELHPKALLLQFDVSDRDACKKAIEKDMENNGVYFGVICNAGITRDKPFPRIKGEDWDDVIRTNLDSFYNVLHPVIMPMVRAKNKGRIITISSISGITGNRGQVNYSAAKAGIIGATKALAQELAKREITVNCVAPGIIETDMVADLPLEEIKRMIPMRRLGKPEEVASLVDFLLSEGAGYLTGQVISPNGGLV